MNVFNRILMILLSLALIGGAASVIVLAWAIPEDSIEGLRDAVDWLDRHNDDLEKALLTGVASLIGLLALILLFTELLPQSGADVKLTGVEGGGAVLTTNAIGLRIEEAVRAVPHIAQVRAAVRKKGRGVKVALDLHVEPEANLATVTDAACDAARDVLANRVHVDLMEPPRARIHYRELRQERATRARAAQAAAAAPAVAAPALAAEPEAASEEAATEDQTAVEGGGEAAAAPAASETAAADGVEGSEEQKPA